MCVCVIGMSKLWLIGRMWPSRQKWLTWEILHLKNCNVSNEGHVKSSVLIVSYEYIHWSSLWKYLKFLNMACIPKYNLFSSLFVERLAVAFHTLNSDHYSVVITCWNLLYKQDSFLGSFHTSFGLAPGSLLVYAVDGVFTSIL